MADTMELTAADEHPTFTQALNNIYNSYSVYLKRTLTRDFNFPEDLYSDWIKYGEFSQRELLYTLGLAVAITLLRHMLAVSLFRVGFTVTKMSSPHPTIIA